MKIERLQETLFGHLHPGDVFVFNNRVFMKTSSTTNSVELENGKGVMLSFHDIVKKINGKFVETI